MGPILKCRTILESANRIFEREFFFQTAFVTWFFENKAYEGQKLWEKGLERFRQLAILVIFGGYFSPDCSFLISMICHFGLRIDSFYGSMTQCSLVKNLHILPFSRYACAMWHRFNCNYSPSSYDSGESSNQNNYSGLSISRVLAN